jgi:integrase
MGTLLRRDYYNRNIWKPAFVEVELAEDTTFHDLRHTFASTALAEGVPISEGLPVAWSQIHHYDSGPLWAPGT